MNHQPHHHDQQQRDSAQGEDHLGFGHVISFPVLLRGGAEAARVAHNHEVTGSSPVPATSFENPAPVLPCRQGPAFAGNSAGAANGPAAFLSAPLSAFLDAGPCFGPCTFIDFDDEREFDFSLIPVRPKLRLVISNSSSVKA